MLLCGLAFILSRDSAGWRENIIAAVLCAAIVLTRSVAAALALAALIACYTVLSRRLNRLVPIAATTATMVALAIFANNAEDSARRHDHFLWDKVSVIVVKDHAANEHLFGSGLSSRIASAKRAIDLWSEHPILGIGLGRFYAGDGARAPSNHPSMIIHSTPLWLLVEFGIVGLAVFAGLFMTFGVWLYYTHGVTGLLILSAWATMALFHELLYQRTPWFALGLCAGIVLSRAPHASPRDAA